MSEKISLNREAKIQAVADIKEKLEKAQSFVVVNYIGLTVEQDTALRKSFREAGVEYKVLKNRLFALALKELGYSDEFVKHLEGPSAFAFGYDDVTAPARVVSENAKKFDKFSIKCGCVEKNYIDEKGVTALAKLPTREVLIATLAGTLQAPISGLARALNSTIGGLAIALKAVADKK